MNYLQRCFSIKPYLFFSLLCLPVLAIGFNFQIADRWFLLNVVYFYCALWSVIFGQAGVIFGYFLYKLECLYYKLWAAHRFRY